MNLLLNPEDRGYPDEYLFSRIRGRRSRLITDWRPFIFSASPWDALASGKYGRILPGASQESVWRGLLREYQWAYAQMSGRLREIFHPFFLYSELRTLFICLRQGTGRKTGGIDELLGVSLLSEEIKDALLGAADVPSALTGIERIFITRSVEFKGLAKIFENDGLRGVEQHLTNTYLSTTAASRLHPLLKMFFIRLIDSRNIMGLSKYARLGLKSPPVFIDGGSISKARFREIIEKEGMMGVASLVRSFTGVKTEALGPANVEIALYKAITRFLKKEGRDPLGIGLILDYLWRCSIEAMNLSVLIHGQDLEREAITAELVR